MYITSKSLSIKNSIRKKNEIENELGINLTWDDPQLNQKQICVGYEINEVNYDDDNQLNSVYKQIIEILVILKKGVQNTLSKF